MEKNVKIENAVVYSTHLGYEDHGIFTAYIELRGNGWGGAFGGYFLDAGPAPKSPPLHVPRMPSARSGFFVMRVLSVLRVDSWERVAKQQVRIAREDGRVTRIGHLIEDRWFHLSELQQFDKVLNGTVSVGA